VSRLSLTHSAVAFLLLILALTPCASATDISVADTGIKVLSKEFDHVRFSWKVDLISRERAAKHCTLRIRFLDLEGYELHAMLDVVTVPAGASAPNKTSFTGQSFCSESLFKQTEKTQVSLSCP